jgi:predicted alpha-1,6-mannanase (GH76 family)
MQGGLIPALASAEELARPLIGFVPAILRYISFIYNDKRSRTPEYVSLIFLEMTPVSWILTFVTALIPKSLAFNHSNIHTQKALLARPDLLSNVVAATNALMRWYNQTNGLWETTSWWNSANCITSLARLTELMPSAECMTGRVWINTFQSAPKHNMFQEGPNGFSNGFYDDEAWWALAWLDVYDVTKNKTYLTTAVEIFDDMLRTGYNATCGGLWWDKRRTDNVAISNELLLQVAARLANRAENNSQYYLGWAKKHWEWFRNSGLINENWNINDGLNTQTCKNNDGIVWSYNQGVILGALVDLAKADRNNTYLVTAKNVASAAVKKLADKDGILHDPREPELGNDGNQFKGVFARNLHTLYDATREPWMKQFLIRNAEVIWSKARHPESNLIGPVWSGPYYPATAATQSSAMDVLIAAMAVS